MPLTRTPRFRAPRLHPGAAALLMLYAALLAGFVAELSRPPPSTVIYAVMPR